MILEILIYQPIWSSGGSELIKSEILIDAQSKVRELIREGEIYKYDVQSSRPVAFKFNKIEAAHVLIPEIGDTSYHETNKKPSEQLGDFIKKSQKELNPLRTKFYIEKTYLNECPDLFIDDKKSIANSLDE